jgi:hypothetical protein
MSSEFYEGEWFWDLDAAGRMAFEEGPGIGIEVAPELGEGSDFLRMLMEGATRGSYEELLHSPSGIDLVRETGEAAELFEAGEAAAADVPLLIDESAAVDEAVWAALSTEQKFLATMLESAGQMEVVQDAMMGEGAHIISQSTIRVLGGLAGTLSPLASAAATRDEDHGVDQSGTWSYGDPETGNTWTPSRPPDPRPPAARPRRRTVTLSVGGGAERVALEDLPWWWYIDNN